MKSFNDLNVGDWFKPVNYPVLGIKIDFDTYYAPNHGYVKDNVTGDMEVVQVTVSVQRLGKTLPFNKITPGTYVDFASGIYMKTRNQLLRISGDGPILESPAPDDKLTIVPGVEIEE